MGGSSIHECAKRGDTAGVGRALERGGAALLEQERESGFTPLHVACWYGHDDVVAALLQAGVDVNRALRTASYSKGVTPLYMAARNGWAKCCMLLLGARADPELAREADGSTPLTAAAKHGQAEVVQVLLRAGVAIDSTDGSDSTPLLLAGQRGHPAVVELLLQAGADPNGSTAWRPNALVVAAFNDDVPVIDAFLRAKPACVSQTLPNGATALHMAAARGNVAATTRLLDAGANPERCRSDGQTALSLASANGHTDAAQVIRQSLETVEGRRPAVSRMQRLKALQKSARVMQGVTAAPAAPAPEEMPAPPDEQQLGRGARAFASFEGGGPSVAGEEQSEERPSSAAASSASSQANDEGDDGDASARSAPMWSKIRLVSRLTAAGQAGRNDARMKEEIVVAVGMLSAKGYERAMAMLAIDGNEDAPAALDLDEIFEDKVDLLRAFHAFVTDSTNHSKRYRHPRTKKRGHASKHNDHGHSGENGDTADDKAAPMQRHQRRHADKQGSENDDTTVVVAEETPAEPEPEPQPEPEPEPGPEPDPEPEPQPKPARVHASDRRGSAGGSTGRRGSESSAASSVARTPSRRSSASSSRRGFTASGASAEVSARTGSGDERIANERRK